MSPRALLNVPDAAINEALAKCMGWIEFEADGAVMWRRGEEVRYRDITYYCSEESPRSLLGQVEERIEPWSKENKAGDYDDLYSFWLYELQGYDPQESCLWPILLAPASIRARACLWVLDRAAAVRLIAEATAAAAAASGRS